MQITITESIAAISMLLCACASTEPSSPYAGGGSASSSPGGGSESYDDVAPASSWPKAGSGGGQAGAQAPATADVELADDAYSSYLTDAEGLPLYMFANDLPGADSSACTQACLDRWPVFDAKDLAVGAGLANADFSRFERSDGAWQTSFKGRPLYRFAMDEVGNGPQGDGVSGRWFVARDYLVFVAAKADVTPQGAAAPSPYMTNRAGRTVYVFLNDTAAAGSNPPVSACVDGCLDSWPAWNAPATLTGAALPSSVRAADFGQFERTVDGAAVQQLTYRGWPLYFHTPDVAPGTTSGHMSGAWRAIDPTTFASAAAP